jgi:hypothetical protein
VLRSSEGPEYLRELREPRRSALERAVQLQSDPVVVKVSASAVRQAVVLMAYPDAERVSHPPTRPTNPRDVEVSVTAGEDDRTRADSSWNCEREEAFAPYEVRQVVRANSCGDHLQRE